MLNFFHFLLYFFTVYCNRYEKRDEEGNLLIDPNNLSNPYDFEINNLLYIDPVSKFVYATSSSKGSVNDCFPEKCEGISSSKPNLIDQILSYNNNNSDIKSDNATQIEPWEELCHFGQHQSPINIGESSSITSQQFNAIYNLHIAQIQWRPFYKTHNFGVENISNCSQPHLIINSPLYNLHDKAYCLSNIHIHLSCDQNILGSEHAIQYEKYNAELHFVYTRFPNLSNTTDESKELTIYKAIFLRVSNSLNHLSSLDKLLKTLINFNSNGENKQNFKMNELTELDEMFDPTKTPLYIYRGSLTSVPCTENILWMILKYPAVISYNTFDQLRKSRIQSLDTNSLKKQENNTEKLTFRRSEIRIKCDNFRSLQNQVKHQVFEVNEQMEHGRKFKLLNTP